MAVDIRGFGLVQPQSQGIAGALGRGLATQQAFQQVGQQNIAAQREAQVRQALSGIQQPQMQPQTEQQQMMAEQTAGLGGALAQAEQPQPITTQEEKIELARSFDPAMANKILKDMGLDDASKRAEMSRFASDLENTPFGMRREKIEARVQQLRAQGRDATQTEKLLDLDETAQNQGLLGIQLADLSTKERMDIRATGVKATAKAALDTLKANLKATKETFDRAGKLRGEIQKASTDFNKQEGAWTRVKASAEDPSPAGDLALIFNFMKVLDPGSTVREGEFAQVGAAGNLPTQVQRMYEQWATGQKLTDPQRNDVVNRAGRLFKAAEKNNKRDIAKFVSIGKQFGVSKENLLGAENPESQIDIKAATLEELQAEAARLKQGQK
jgi:Pyruvate/2-oxoacid:ferredoxin oxidoreductase gamma subunit